MAAKKVKFERLPTSVIPVNYKLELKPDLENLTFDGEETILVEVKSAVDKIVLNAREISISYADIALEGGQRTWDNVDIVASENEQVVFNMKETLQPGSYKLHLKFSGILNDEMRGFYRTQHKKLGEPERNGALTHFEATGARRAFPCFDEPALRATFNVTLVVPCDRTALSNMPSKSEEVLPDKNCKVVHFDTTPPMPTYLVAFVVGDYDCTCAKDEDGVEIRVYTPQGKSEQGSYATQVAATTLPFYRNYFGIPYNLPKLDLVAAPDFPIGAMENWGLVIYRQGALLVDPEQTSSAMKEFIALIIGHELAHNWFGNLVTMNWWTHLWLKEGFASWIEYLCVDHCFPKYDIWTQFVTNDLSKALKLDALDNSHPIEIEVGDPAEVDEIFDAISYSKGASIINMLHDYLGDENFRKGMTAYLKRHEYQSACTEDLWNALEEASGKSVRHMMGLWTSQKGFPVLTVQEKESEGSERVLEITQKKFSAAVADKPSADDSLWVVPIAIQTESGREKTILMEERKITVTVPKNSWVKLNAGTKGVYRVQYCGELLKMLVPCIQKQVVPPVDRLGIISDLFALCEVGMVSSVELLEVVAAFSGETNFTVWKDLLTNLSEMGQLLQYTNDNVTSTFRTFIRRLLQQIYRDVGLEYSENEHHMTSKLRELVVTFLGMCGEESVVKYAMDAFNSHVDGTRLIPSDMRRAVYMTVMAHGNMQHYIKLKQLHAATDSIEEMHSIAGSFGSSKDTAILQDALEFSVSEAVRSQDSPIVIGRISAGSAKGRELAWAFFKKNYKMLYQRYSSSTLLARLVKTGTQDFASEEMAREIEEFFSEHPAPSAERTVQQSCEKIRLSAQWLKKEKDGILSLLDNLLEVSFREGEGMQERRSLKTAGAEEQDRLSNVVVELIKN